MAIVALFLFNLLVFLFVNRRLWSTADRQLQATRQFLSVH